jgi:hypothetical protein
VDSGVLARRGSKEKSLVFMLIEVDDSRFFRYVKGNQRKNCEFQAQESSEPGQ